MAVTIKEIARIAGVSRGTVDKALNDRPGIREETRKKIQKIAKELDYHPNIIGKVLVNSGTPIRIGVLLTPLYNPFIDLVIQGIKDAESEFADFNCKVIIKTSISLEPMEHIWLLDELEAEQVSGIVALPVEDAAFVERINRLHDNGVQIVTFNSYVEGTKQVCYVGQDHYKGGRTAAGLMGKLLPEGGEIGIIISSRYLSCHTSRLKGFEDRLGELKQKFDIVEVLENQDLQGVAFRHTLEYCSKYPNLKGLYLTGGGEAGAARALELIGAKDRVALICYDVIPEIKDYMRRGTIDFVIDQDGYRQGYQSVKILFEKLIKGLEPQDNVYRIPVTIATGDSLAD